MSDTFEVHLERLDGYRFRADLGPDLPPLLLDEPPPLGAGRGPNPARLLAVAVADCLSASLVFCLTRSRAEVGAVKTHVVGTYVRNERNRLRIGGLDVTIEIEAPAGDKLEKCLAAFEDFCVVTASVRQGLDVSVTVVDPSGAQLHAAPPPAEPE